MFKKLIDSYIQDQYFVSTMHRQSSVCIIPAPWFYETTVFCQKTGKVLEQYDSGSDPENAMINHHQVCLQYFKKTVEA